MAEKKLERPFFGRKSELAYLRKRAETKGLTAVVGRPQAGKSWLLEEFRDQLEDDDGFQVGYAEAPGGHADLLLRSMSDLYKRWFSKSSFRKQAGILWEQHKSDLTTKVGGTIGSLLGRIVELTNPQAKGVAKGIDECFTGLHKANLDLQSGGISAPALGYDQVRDLVWVLDSLSKGKTRAVLILDAFDRTSGAELETGSLRKFLGRLDEWPECHIFVVTRAPDAKDEANEEIGLRCCRKLASASPAAALWEIPDLDVAGDLEESDRLLRYLNAEVPATDGVPIDRLMDMISGVPGVIGAWLIAQKNPTETPKDESDLKRLAAEAHANNHHEIEPLLLALLDENKEVFNAAVRLVLLPEVTSQQWFEVYRPVLEAGLDNFPLARLQGTGLLEQDRDLGGHPAIPTFGHTTRYQTARDLVCADKRFKSFAWEEACALIIELATLVTGTDPATLPFGAALLNLRMAAKKLDLPEAHRGLCESAVILFKLITTSAESLLIEKSTVLTVEHPEVAPLVAMALNNAVGAAKKENNLPRRNQLLERLRQLASARSDDAAVQGMLARCLFNTLCDMNEENNRACRISLVDELRQLATTQSDVPAVQREFASALSNAINDARREKDSSVAEALLNKLKTLATDHIENKAVQSALGTGIRNSFIDAKQQGDVSASDMLLDNMRQLAASQRENSEVQEHLATILLDALGIAMAQDDSVRGDALLDELRMLASSRSDDPKLQQLCAKGVSNALFLANGENSLSRRNMLLTELRGLAAELPDDPGVLEAMANALFGLLNDARRKNDLSGRDALLDELRELAGRRPDDLASQQRLAMGLANTLIDVIEEDDPKRRDTLLDELRGLSERFPDDPTVQEQLAISLFNTLTDAKEEDDLRRRDALLDELRELAMHRRDDPAVQKQLAMGLFNTLQQTVRGNDRLRVETLVPELRELCDRYPELQVVKEIRDCLKPKTS